MAVKPNQIEKLLQDLMGIKEKYANAKEILKSYKVKSDRLTELQKAKKEMLEQITDEKNRIEDEFYEDKDYEQSKNDELTYGNQIREKSSELRKVMAEVNPDQQLSTYDYNIKGEKLKMQVERIVKVYINGKEEK
ncbi:hypothetical protein KJ742_06295 [Patescibacteria group bacterium]|nr:hypothetical protein [Patescibacteria group bacterium]MBU1683521.1 hypothetical protein [Patescibacteria group bacterium]MBU1935186.1 hypothetical protein [Patescibacteria group bacterium]